MNEGHGTGTGTASTERSTPVGAAVAALGRELGRLVEAFDPEVVTAGDAAELVQAFAEVERLGAAGRLLATARMARTSVWAGEGDTDVAGWVARTTGQSTADAKRDLAAARALDGLDDTREALRRGRLTKEQVREIAPAAAVAPGQEGDLLDEAARGSVDRLAGKARAAKAAARRDGPEAVARMRRRRAVTDGRADDGSAWLRASGPPDDIARVLAGLVPWADAARGQARGIGEPLTDEQARFDGLVALAAQPVPAEGLVMAGGPGVTADDTDTAYDTDNDDDDHDTDNDDVGTRDDLGTDDANAAADPGTDCDGDACADTVSPCTGRALDPRRGRPRWAAKVIVNVDLQALRRGFAVAGERSEITGVGPVPVAVIDDLLQREDTFVAAVVRDGIDIQQVAHLGRGPTAAQRTALEADHTTCCIDGCADPPKVIDHHHRFADGGPLTLANLGPLCATHDARKTHHGWILVRHGRSRRLLPPDHPLVTGAIPGGFVDLDDPPHELPPASEPSDHPGRGETAGAPPPELAPAEPHQLDLLAG